MTVEIDPRASVGKSVVLGEGTSVGAYAVIEDGVTIGKNNKLWPHAFVGRGTTLGDGNHVHPYATIGHLPQDIHFKPETETFTRIGNGNTFREHSSVHRATKPGQATTIGDRCFIMANAHIAHDCRIGNGIIMVNGAALPGHCEAHDGVIMSGFTGIHQFARIGRFVMLSALSVTNKDLAPFFIYGGRPAAAIGVNLVGLRRNGFSRELRAEIKRAFKILYREGLTLPEALLAIEHECPSPEARYLLEFIKSSKRGIAFGAADTLKPKWAKGEARRGGPSDDDEDETPEVL